MQADSVHRKLRFQKTGHDSPQNLYQQSVSFKPNNNLYQKGISFSSIWFRGAAHLVAVPRPFHEIKPLAHSRRDGDGTEPARNLDSEPSCSGLSYRKLWEYPRLYQYHIWRRICIGRTLRLTVLTICYGPVPREATMSVPDQ
eukprot:2074755-Rhodomonas_salina.2